MTSRANICSDQPDLLKTTSTDLSSALAGSGHCCNSRFWECRPCPLWWVAAQCCQRSCRWWRPRREPHHTQRWEHLSQSPTASPPAKTCMVTTWVTVKKYSHCPGQSLTRMARPGCQFQCSAVPFLLIYLHIKGSSLSVPLLTILSHQPVCSGLLLTILSHQPVCSGLLLTILSHQPVCSGLLLTILSHQPVCSGLLLTILSHQPVCSGLLLTILSHQPVCSGLLMPLQSEWIISLTAF